MELAVKRFNGIFKKSYNDRCFEVIVLDNDHLDEQLSVLDEAVNSVKSKNVFYVVCKINDTYIAEFSYSYRMRHKIGAYICSKGYCFSSLYFDDKCHCMFENGDFSIFFKLKKKY